MSNHGGKRENAGRPRGQGKFGEPTVTMRIPESQIATIKDFLEALQRKRANMAGDNAVSEVDEFFVPEISDQPALLPLFATRVAAGFPSSADDHVEKRLDVSEFLIDHAASTFFVTIKGDSMIVSVCCPVIKWWWIDQRHRLSATSCWQWWIANSPSKSSIMVQTKCHG